MPKSSPSEEANETPGSFSRALALAIETSGLDRSSLCAASGILKRQELHNLLKGRRAAGPKVMAALLTAFRSVEGSQGKKAQEILVTGYLETTLDLVKQHLGSGATGQIQNTTVALLGGNFLKSLPSGSSQEAQLPRWVDELIQEAIEAGEGEPEVVELISSVMKSVTQSKLVRSSRKPKKR